ncbi:MAG: YqeG family HAD IIIA-type phosphatase [Armatimonadetes bacterium]|nr:YqeG family HAD IIIA-type phosphatase [Armatimonadota bacterium]
MNKLLKLFCPDEYLSSVSQIDLQALRNRGFSAILVDLDNTLVPWRKSEVPKETHNWLQKAKEYGFKVCIVSNTRFPNRLKRLAKEMNLPYVNKVLKPRRGGFREALRLLDVEPEHAVVVGDQVFTDILGGERLGLYTILVRPLSKHEFIATIISRFFERMLLRFFERRGMLAIKDGVKPL